MPLQLSRAWRVLTLSALLVLGTAAGVNAAESKVSVTPHNLSKSGPGAVIASNETQICVFCHTPHGANTSVKAPLWNRNVNTAQTYTRYTSSSLDAETITDGFSAQPGGSSVLCLSCHDGMLALGNVNVLWGQPANIALVDGSNNAVSTMPSGSGALTGNTRNLQTDLSNDHPISVTYNDALAAADGEMTRMTTANPAQRDVISGKIIGIRTNAYKPLLPLEPTGKDGIGQIQCATCHDPHLTAQKFLRANRFQVATPTGGDFSEANDQICLACHPKLGAAWAESAHANPTVADEAYLPKAAAQRTFPGTPAVWQVACLNCHDTHTAQGSRRLLREGIAGNVTGDDAGSFRSLSTAVAADKLNTVSAIENTCYQCHTGQATKIIGTKTGTVPDIRTEFETRTYRMPLKTTDQAGTTKLETHDIRNANFVECRRNMGNTGENEPTGDHLTAAQKAKCDTLTGGHEKRHVECTDCHNPHRVRRSSTFYGTSADSGEGDKRTHNPGTNVASGVLRGTWGVEPVYTTTLGATWPQKPDRYDVKKGDPGSSTSTARSSSYLTREYQLCFKCHSDYSNGTTAAGFPSLGNTGGGTSGSSANGMQKYTNVAAEFASVKINTSNPDVPATFTDQGEETRSGKACGGILNGQTVNSGFDCDPTPSLPGGTNNHRSWHPVMYPTGRDKDERGSASFSNIRAPFNSAVGTQTMYCSDCHGDPGSWTAGTGPNNAVAQGPHGSSKPFLLKGDWVLDSTSNRPTTSQTPSSPGVCGNCHAPKGSVSGFAGATEASHGWDGKDGVPCNYCHIALPHGWKNKAFLVNTNCVGPESGRTDLTYDSNGCSSGARASDGYVEAPPYYRRALLRINAWRVSGSWAETACGDGSGKTWMTEVCREGW